MALSNRDRIDRMFQVLAPALDDYISSVVGQGDPKIGAAWVKLVEAKDSNSSKSYDPLDPQVQLRMLTESSITSRFKSGWYPFNDTLGHIGESFASELREIRNTWAHNGSFTDDDAYRALDTAERLLKLIGAPTEADQVRPIRLSLRRVSAEKDDKRTLKAAAGSNPDSGSLKPWREVLQPHQDVATGNFRASEFAADLYKVAAGQNDQGNDYSDPVEFFRRTYLTEGLQDLIGRAVKRLSDDPNASPVINLQTNFGGGKTHSMLSLWHLAGGTPLGDYPQDVQEVLAENGFGDFHKKNVRRVALVGNHISPSGEQRGTQRIHTLWGELAWQLGGAEAYEIVAEADQTGTNPGGALHQLLEQYSPAVILIDEWVAYARQLPDESSTSDRIVGGTFDTQFTFAQSLTEAVKATPGVLLAISIPASDTGMDGTETTVGNAEEVGGSKGLETVERLQNVVRRVADQWRPASSEEAYHIVRRRLFVEPTAEALADIGATAQSFSDMYRRHQGEFPRESRDGSYLNRIKHTYPIHPELFDRLYENWSSLERFQRTRGVLRLMNTVIHALWEGEDASALIMPGSIPLSVADVNSELTGYLPDQWKAVIDTDVDGTNSVPHRIDSEKPLFGKRSLTKRLARTVFFGAAPTIGSAHKGIETQRVFLGTALPGDVPGNFHSALNQLTDRATYFYSGSGKYWYDTQANITRTAKDQAERMHREEVWAEIIRRLASQQRVLGDFAGVHVCPTENSDIPDTDEARLVILHPKTAHSKRAESSAWQFAKDATERKGSASRVHRNMVIYLAADESRLTELESAARDYLGWTHILAQEVDLDLTINQKQQAQQRKDQASSTIEARLLQTFTWALVPHQPDPAAPFVIRETKIEGESASLAERASKRLSNDGDLATQQAAASIRLAIDQVPKIWETGHVSVGELWSLYATYPYMPRLRDRSVLDSGLTHQPILWQADGFALAAAYDQVEQRYVGLVSGGDADAVIVSDSTLLVQPEAAESQLESDASQAAAKTTPRQGSGSDAEPESSSPTPSGADSSADLVFAPVDLKTRFYGVKTLKSDRIAVDFRNVMEEVVNHFRDQAGAEVRVKIEIEATDAQGFDERQVRTVSENAHTLKFDEAGFEES